MGTKVQKSAAGALAATSTAKVAKTPALQHAPESLASKKRLENLEELERKLKDSELERKAKQAHQLAADVEATKSTNLLKQREREEERRKYEEAEHKRRSEE